MFRPIAAVLGAALALVPTVPVAAAAASPVQPRVWGVDVSQRPRATVSLTVPEAGQEAPAVSVAGARGRSWVRRVRPAEVDVFVVPDPQEPDWPAQRAALARFVLQLPVGVRVAVVAAAAEPPRRDPVAAAQHLMALPPGGAPDGAYPRLLRTLASVPRDGRGRRLVVLAADGDLPSGPVADYLGRRLQAEGTSLYVLDRSPAGLPVLGALAAAGGGLVLPGRPATASAALAPVLTDLSSQYAVTFERSGTGAQAVRLRVGVPGRPTGEVTAVLPAGPAPAAGPPPPVPPAAAATPAPALPEALLPLAAGLLVVVGVGYGMGMLIASRRPTRQRPETAVPTDDLFFVFLLPCLNEERVILASLERLTAIPSQNYAALVVDDGSDDATAELVGGVAGERVWLLRRFAPNARQGKGEALNAAIEHLLAGDRLRGHDPENVVIVVVDADGRLDPSALAAVTPYFADPAVGGVQIGVRINNRFTSLLARLQDMEFVIYTDVFQRGRRHLGSVGMGGNGQFMRLSALLSLGGGPWTRSLTEDLDLGIRLLNTGWRNEFCHDAAVHQQGVTQLRRLVRQRSRWFQGHLQSWRLIPSVLRSAPPRAAPDLVYHLTSPALLLIGSMLTASFLVSMVAAAVALVAGHDVVGWWVLTTYTLSFGPAMTYTALYWRHERRHGLGPLKAVALAHLYVSYGLVWAAAGWWGLTRHVRGRTGWAKTERLVEAPVTVPTAGGPS